jgi:formate dehydrogenase maturation protein FdhE
VVPHAAVGDAFSVFGRRQILVSDLRSCPVCGSSAICDVEMEELGLTRTRWLLRCGQCRTTRAYVVRLRQATALARALERALESDRREMLRAVRRADAAGAAGAGPNATLNARRTS